MCAEVGVSAHRAGRVQMKAIDRQMYTKKLPNIQNYQRNVQQKYMLIHFTLVRLAINKRNNKCWWGCRGKAPSIHHSGKYKSVHSLQKLLWILPKKIKLMLPYYPAILFLGTCLRDSKLAWHRDACSSMFIVAPFTITNLCK